MKKFLQAEPQWSRPQATANFLSGGSVQPAAVGYWPLPALGLAVAGNRTASVDAVRSIQSAADRLGNAWPYTTGDAGQMILAESGGRLLAA